MTIELKNISKRLGNTLILNNINLKLESGHIYGFQGINGSGKTMLMRVISGLIYPNAGNIFIDDEIVEGSDSFPDSMGLLLETPSFLGNFSGKQNLSLLAEISGNISEQMIDTAISRVGLANVANIKYKKYSLGMKQRLGIACAIMEAPKLIILDEPFNSIDEQGIQDIKQILIEEKQRNALIILTCHDIELLYSISDTIYKIVAGEITKTITKRSNGYLLEESLI